MSRNDDAVRAQVGIGTLVIFISMVLVAAIAAGVLVSTAGSLQSKSEETGGEASTQVTNRLQVVAVSGSAIGGDSLGRVNVTVKKAPGSENIDLENTTVSWVGPSGSFNLVENDVDEANADGEFYASRFKDPDDSHPVLNQLDDRVVVVFDVGTDDFTNGGLGEFGSRLTEGSSVTLTLTTKSGGQTQVTMVVPESPDGKEAVNL